MKLKRAYFLIIVFIVAFRVGHGQQSFGFNENLFLEVDYGYGTLMPHHNSIKYFLEDRIQTFDVKLSKLTYGNKYWNQLYRFPNYGIGYYRSNLGNDKIYGYANGFYAFFKAPVFGKSDGFNLSSQFAFGMAYITKIFDTETNYQNLAIGSHLNIFLDFSLHSAIPLTRRLALTNQIRFTHFSNGKITSPNKGLNLLSGSIGLQYQLSNELKTRIINELPVIHKKNNYSLIYAAGIKTISRYAPGNFFASSLIFDFNRNYSLKGRWNVGADIFYDDSNKEKALKYEGETSDMDPFLFGIHAGHDLVAGDLSLVINLGGYVYAPVEQLAPIYSRIGLRYRIKNKIIANLTLKSHWAKASFVEWGVGYVF